MLGAGLGDEPLEVGVLVLGAGLAGVVLAGAAGEEGVSSVVDGDSGVGCAAETCNGEGAADEVAGASAVVAGVDGPVGPAGWDVGADTDDVVDVESFDDGVDTVDVMDFTDGVGSTLVAGAVGDVRVLTGVVCTDVRRVGAVEPPSEAASGPSTTKPPTVAATASAPPAASALPTRAGRTAGRRPSRGGPGWR